MGMLMIHCPRTGRQVSTGRNVDAATFRSSPVFFSRVYCPHRKAMHEWFAADAWVREAENSERSNGFEQETVVSRS